MSIIENMRKSNVALHDQKNKYIYNNIAIQSGFAMFERLLYASRQKATLDSINTKTQQVVKILATQNAKRYLRKLIRHITRASRNAHCAIVIVSLSLFLWRVLLWRDSNTFYNTHITLYTTYTGCCCNCNSYCYALETRIAPSFK